LGWVSQLMGWVGSGHIKWTHGQLCVTLTPIFIFISTDDSVVRYISRRNGCTDRGPVRGGGDSWGLGANGGPQPTYGEG